MDENRITAPESEPTAPKKGRRKKAATAETAVTDVTAFKETSETKVAALKETKAAEIKASEKTAVTTETAGTAVMAVKPSRKAKPMETAEAQSREMPENEDAEPLAPLKTAAGRIARLLCELSGDSALFVSEAGQVSERRVDTKALKEFSGVLKEMSAVINELHLSDGADGSEGVRIEFSDEALELGS